MNKKKVWSKVGVNKSFPYICTTNQERQRRHDNTKNTLSKDRKSWGWESSNEMQGNNIQGGRGNNKVEATTKIKLSDIY